MTYILILSFRLKTIFILPQPYVQMETLGCLVLVYQGVDEWRSAGMRRGAPSVMDYGQPMMAMWPADRQATPDLVS